MNDEPPARRRPGKNVRKGRPGQLFVIDFKAIEKMPRKSPDQIREIADAYVKGNELGFAAGRIAQTLKDAIHPDAFDSAKTVELKLREAWKKAGSTLVFQCAGNLPQVLPLLEAVVKSMRLDSDARTLKSSGSRYRFSVVANAYANVWDGLIAEGKRRRPTMGELRRELTRGRAMLKKSGVNDEVVAELDSILDASKNLSRYTGNLFF